MSARVEIDAWGRMPEWVRDRLSGRAIVQEHEARSEAVARSIARRTGLVWCAGPRGDGTALRNNKPEFQHYHGTLGRPVPRRLGGGFQAIAELWFRIPCARPQSR